MDSKGRTPEPEKIRRRGRRRQQHLDHQRTILAYCHSSHEAIDRPHCQVFSPCPPGDIAGWININGMPVPANGASKLHESVWSTGSTCEGYALSSPDNKYNCNLTPDQIRILAEVGDPLAMRKEWLVFCRISGPRYQINPEFVWVLFEKRGNQFPISLNRMKLVFPEYEMVMERFHELKQTAKDMEVAASGKPARPTMRPASSTDAPISPAVASRLNPELKSPRKRTSDELDEPEDKCRPEYRSSWRPAGAK